MRKRSLTSALFVLPLVLSLGASAGACSSSSSSDSGVHPDATAAHPDAAADAGRGDLGSDPADGSAARLERPSDLDRAPAGRLPADLFPPK